MALIVEDGSGASGADTYASTDTCEEYAGNHGKSFAASPADDAEAALRRATIFIDAYTRDRLPGSKTNGRSQALQWPRSDAVDIEGEDIADDEVPTEIVRACCEAAIYELANPGGLSPTYTQSQRIKSEQVGSLAITYTDPVRGVDDVRPVLTAIDDLLSGLLGKPRKGALYGFSSPS